MEGGYHTCISGETGTGKSVIIQKFLNDMDPEKYVNCTVNFSAQTSSNNLQDVFMEKLNKLLRTTFGPPIGKK